MIEANAWRCTRHIAVWATLLLPPLAPLAVAQTDVDPLIARIESPQIPNRQGFDGFTIKELMQHFHVPGVSIAVIKDFQIHWVKSYGVADVETGRPVDSCTAFQAASISKPVTAIATLRLADEGRLNLDADVNHILKSWRVPSSEFTRRQAVTPRSLLSHTSGADDGFGFPGYDPAATLPTVVQILNGEPPSNVGPVLFARAPFQAQKYSGGGIMIMQLAIVDLTGKPFTDFIRAAILDPLGMTNSSYEQPITGKFAQRAARAHNADGKSSAAPWHTYPEQAAAGLWTTPSDLALFVIEVQNAVKGPRGKVLSQPTASEMVTPVGVGPFGLGLVVEKRGEGWYFSHGGSNWGFRAKLLGHLRKGYGLIIMTNGDSGNGVITELEARVAVAYGWDSLDKPIVR